MKPIKSYSLALLLASMTLLITACSGGSSAPAALPTYKVEYVAGTPSSPTVGKTTFQLKISYVSDGSAATGKNVSLVPMMYMPTMTHSTPVDVVTESSTPGTYDCTIYYIMASSDEDHWELEVMISGEAAATLSPTVGGGMISIPKLKGQSPDDVIKTMMGGMSTTEPRTYYLLKDGPTTTTSISLFIAAQENNKMSFSRVYSGATFTNASGDPWPITDVTVEAATDPLGSWQTGTNGGTGGHWTLPTTLSSGGTGTVYVRLFVNTVQKSTDSLATGPTDSNGYQTLVVTEGI